MIYIIKTEYQDLTFQNFDQARNSAIEMGYNCFRDSLGDKYYI